jgi:hypothetical protein
MSTDKDAALARIEALVDQLDAANSEGRTDAAIAAAREILQIIDSHHLPMPIVKEETTLLLNELLLK